MPALGYEMTTMTSTMFDAGEETLMKKVFVLLMVAALTVFGFACKSEEHTNINDPMTDTTYVTDTVYTDTGVTGTTGTMSTDTMSTDTMDTSGTAGVTGTATVTTGTSTTRRP